MTRIEYNEIFRIAEDAIYYNGGKIFLSDIVEKDGYHGEEKLADGEFIIEFNCAETTVIAFPFRLFGQGQNAVARARAKCGSCSLFLNEAGIKIKEIGSITTRD